MPPDPQSIAVDLPCVGCGYNLRMQPAAGLCPECALAVASSLAQTILHWGSSRLRRIAWALRVQAITFIVIPLLLPAGALLDEFVISKINPRDSDLVGICTFGAMAIVAILHTLAAWVATGAPPQERHTGRWLCQIAAPAVPLALFVPMFAILFARFDGESGNYLLLALPPLLAGCTLYAERAAALWVDFHRRAGLLTRAGLGKWSLRLFALAMCLLTAFAGILALLVNFERLFDIVLPSLPWPTISLWLARVVFPALLGTFALAGISALLIIIALFLCATRAAELARLALPAGQTGFTAPPHLMSDAPSSLSSSAAPHPVP
jgi:hypothetical protein